MSLSLFDQDLPFRTALRDGGGEAAARRAASVTHRDVDATEVEEWCRHPDERVVLALAENAGLRDLRYVQERVRERALEDARSEGLLWSELLDRIAAVEPQGAGAPAWAASHFEDPGLRARIRRWAEAETDAERVQQLLEFRSRAPAGIVFRDAACADRLIDAACRDGWAVRSALADNDHLSGAGAAYLARRVLTDAFASRESMEAASGPLGDFLRTLRSAGHPLPPSARERLYGFATRPPGGAADAYEDDLRRSLARDALLDAGATLSPGDLRAFADGAGEHRLQRVLDHPEAGEETWHFLRERAVGMCPEHALAVLRPLLACAGARRNPEVRRTVLEAGAPELWAQLLEDASPEEFAEVFVRGVAEPRLREALGEYGTPERWAAVSPAHWSHVAEDVKRLGARRPASPARAARHERAEVERVWEEDRQARERARMLARVPSAAERPAVREAVLKDGEPEALAALLVSAPAAYARDVWDRALKVDPLSAVMAAGQRQDVGEFLDTPDLAALLQSHRSEVRLQAIALASRLRSVQRAQQLDLAKPAPRAERPVLRRLA